MIEAKYKDITLSNKSNYDVGIIGAGVAGAFAALKAATSYKNSSVVLFDLGRPPGKRRRQLEGWLGCLPTGDGKIYVDDNDKILEVVDGRKVRHANNWAMSVFDGIGQSKVIKDKLPSNAIQKKVIKSGFEIKSGSYFQWKPEYVHKLSRYLAEEIDTAGNVELSFDNEVFSIVKQKNKFVVTTQTGDFICNKLVLCVGRSGWRWSNELYKKLGMTVNDDYANYGIRIELPAQYMKDFNKSHCSWLRDDITVGPFLWNGTVIPEDHADSVISAFRSNEDRWKSDKVVFNLLGKRLFKDQGCYQTDRIAKLTFLLFNDRVGREKIKSILKKESEISKLPEYDWLIDSINELSDILPEIVSRGYFHAPTINPLTSEIRIGSNLETEVDGLFVAGESARFTGIAAAAISGSIALDAALK